MATIWSILLAILIFGCIIAIHEFGHFIAAKRNGIQVNEFAIGMGPKIFRFQKGETLYSLRLFPVGGFCSMEGEDAESKNARAFDQKPVWRRMIVVLAGAFMNLVLGFVLLIATTCSDPYLISNTIHGFHKQATSNTCGLQAGDTIVSLNGSHIFTITDLQYKLSNESGEPFTVVVERDGKKVKLQDVTFRDQENNDWLDFSLEPQQKTVFHVLSYAAKDTVATGKLIWMSLTELVTGKYGIQDLSGPVGTVEVISNAATAGATAAERISSVLHLTIFITINVGIFNLLPIPGNLRPEINHGFGQDLTRASAAADNYLKFRTINQFSFHVITSSLTSSTELFLCRYFLDKSKSICRCFLFTSIFSEEPLSFNNSFLNKFSCFRMLTAA